jgi:putative transposase
VGEEVHHGVARRRHTPEQIIRKLRESDRLLAEGAEVAEVARDLEVSEQTYHRWRNQYGGMKADDAKRLKDLERENARLKRIVADKELEIDALREIVEGKLLSRPRRRRVCRCCRSGSGCRSGGLPDRRPAPLQSAPRARSRLRLRGPARGCRAFARQHGAFEVGSGTTAG